MSSNLTIMSASMVLILLTTTLLCSIGQVTGLLCYQCVSTEPGCTMERVDWLLHSAVSCPKASDKCVKIIESRGAEVRVTRDCLSSITPYRHDIPQDHFEGCRPAVSDPKDGVYVDNAIHELEIKRSYFSNTTYCFCEFDHWCNAAQRTQFGLTWLLALPLLLAPQLIGWL